MINNTQVRFILSNRRKITTKLSINKPQTEKKTHQNTQEIC